MPIELDEDASHVFEDTLPIIQQAPPPLILEQTLSEEEAWANIKALRAQTRGRYQLDVRTTKHRIKNAIRQIHEKAQDTASTMPRGKKRELVEGVTGQLQGIHSSELVESKDIDALIKATNREFLVPEGIKIHARNSIAILGLPDGTIEIPKPQQTDIPSHPRPTETKAKPKAHSLIKPSEEKIPAIIAASERSRSENAQNLLRILLENIDGLDSNLLCSQMGIDRRTLSVLIGNVNKGILNPTQIIVSAGDGFTRLLEKVESLPESETTPEQVPSKQIRKLLKLTQKEIQKLIEHFKDDKEFSAFLKGFATKRRQRTEKSVYQLLADIYGPGVDTREKLEEFNEKLAPLEAKIRIFPRIPSRGDSSESQWEMQTTKIQVIPRVTEQTRQYHREAIQLTRVCTSPVGKAMLGGITGKYGGLPEDSLEIFSDNPRETSQGRDAINRNTLRDREFKIHRRNGIMFIAPKEGPATISRDEEDLRTAEIPDTSAPERLIQIVNLLPKGTIRDLLASIILNPQTSSPETAQEFLKTTKTGLANLINRLNKILDQNDMVLERNTLTIEVLRPERRPLTTQELAATQTGTQIVILEENLQAILNKIKDPEAELSLTTNLGDPEFLALTTEIERLEKELADAKTQEEKFERFKKGCNAIMKRMEEELTAQSKELRKPRKELTDTTVKLQAEQRETATLRQALHASGEIGREIKRTAAEKSAKAKAEIERLTASLKEKHLAATESENLLAEEQATTRTLQIENRELKRLLKTTSTQPTDQTTPEEIYTSTEEIRPKLTELAAELISPVSIEDLKTLIKDVRALSISPNQPLLRKAVSAYLQTVFTAISRTSEGDSVKQAFVAQIRNPKI
jgi:hypothetical protein